MALVATLWVHVPEMRGRWLILHFDHALRGRAAAADARFVSAIARGLGERCVVGRRSRAASDGPAGRGKRVSEAAAREARFAFFAHAMVAGGARTLALGHQADDVMETMLMRMARGSGAGGLAAPRAVHRRSDGTVRLRPLLGLTGAEIRAALRAARVPWREDASNHGDVFLRNRVRQRVAPALRDAVGPGVVGGFLASREALEDDEIALEAWLGELAGPCDARRWAALADRPRALARRAVQAWVHATGVGDSLSRPAAEAIVAAVASGHPIRVSAGPARFIVFDGVDLRLDRTPMRSDSPGWGSGAILAVGGTLAGPDGAALVARRRRLTARLRGEILSGQFSPQRVVFLATQASAFHVRQRRAGDRYRPLGGPGRSSVQDLMVNRKIPRGWRDRLPVVCDATGSLLWVPGLPPAHEMAVQHGTNGVVQLTYIPPGAIVPTP